MVAYLLIGSLGQLQEQLEAARSGERGSKKLLAAGERVLTKVIVEKNKLRNSNTQLGEELKDVGAQLANFVKENKRLQGGIFSMWSNLPACNSEIKGTDRVMSVGMLTGRPEEEMSGFSGDLLQELSQVHEQAL